MDRLSVAEAAKVLGISADGVRKRIRRGELPAEKTPRAQGFTWTVDLSDLDSHQDTSIGENEALRNTIAILREQLELTNHHLGLTLSELAETRKALPTPKKDNWFSRLLTHSQIPFSLQRDK